MTSRVVAREARANAALEAYACSDVGVSVAFVVRIQGVAARLSLSDPRVDESDHVPGHLSDWWATARRPSRNEVSATVDGAGLPARGSPVAQPQFDVDWCPPDAGDARMRTSPLPRNANCDCWRQCVVFPRRREIRGAKRINGLARRAGRDVACSTPRPACRGVIGITRRCPQFSAGWRTPPLSEGPIRVAPTKHCPSGQRPSGTANTESASRLPPERGFVAGTLERIRIPRSGEVRDEHQIGDDRDPDPGDLFRPVPVEMSDPPDASLNASALTKGLRADRATSRRRGLPR